MSKSRSRSMPVEKARSAGGVLLRRRNGVPEVCMIRPAGTRRWQLPKGHVEEGETPAETAAREVLEETGHAAEVLERLGDHTYRFVVRDQGPRYRVVKTVDVFLMHDRGRDGVPDGDEVDRVTWMPEPQAVETLTFDDERELMLRGFRRFDSLVPREDA